MDADPAEGVSAVGIAERKAVAGRLAELRTEVEEAALARAVTISDPAEIDDADYLDGLNSTVSAAVSYVLTTLETGAAAAPSVPLELLEQARHAARCDVSLDTVLRRYFAGYILVGNLLVAECGSGELVSSEALNTILGEQAVVFDRLIIAVSEEHSRMAESSSAERRFNLVRRLLAGETSDLGKLDYEPEQLHLGLIAIGHTAAASLRRLAHDLDRRLLMVGRDDGSIWAWLGGRAGFDLERLEVLVSEQWADNDLLSLGEPAPGLDGWRLSHRQARAAQSLLAPGERYFVQYGKVALLAAVMQDDLLKTSLRRLYLDPLTLENREGEGLCKTLEVYFAAERNVTSAAAALSISRKTVSSRLRTVERLLGRSLPECAAELETALSLHSLDDSTLATQ